MIKIHHFNEAYMYYKQQKITFRLLQDQAAVTMNYCQSTHASINHPKEVTETHVEWLMLQPEALQDYVDYLGGYVYICETEEDLKKIHGSDFEWAESHDGHWPNVTDMKMSWDVCDYLEEASNDPQWVIFLLCWNNAGGPVYYVPKHLWAKARVTEHIEATNPNPNI